MKIGILGTRGIPNNYGGFEQCAEYLAAGLTKRGHDVTVYSSHKHTYREDEWNGVKIIHCNDPEHKFGTFGQFIYDLNCILDARKRKFDIILQLGYSSSSIWGWLLPRRPVITTNMDGLEWKRSKFSKPVRLFLRFAERLGVCFSDYLISDSPGIQSHLRRKYNRGSVYIPYGAVPVMSPDPASLTDYGVTPGSYLILVARMEPENNIQTIIDGVIESGTDMPLLVVGGLKNNYSKQLLAKYAGVRNIIFPGAIYDAGVLNALRYHSALYFHGHSVGGTNPSLLEAMACHCLICANENEFNRAVLGGDAYYFTTSRDISGLLKTKTYLSSSDEGYRDRNIKKIEEVFNWERIVDSYENHFFEIQTKQQVK